MQYAKYMGLDVIAATGDIVYSIVGLGPFLFSWQFTMS